MDTAVKDQSYWGRQRDTIFLLHTIEVCFHSTGIGIHCFSSFAKRYFTVLLIDKFLGHFHTWWMGFLLLLQSVQICTLRWPRSALAPFGPQLNPDSDSPTWVWFWFWFSDLILILQLDFDFDSLTWFWFSNLILIFVSLIQFLFRFLPDSLTWFLLGFQLIIKGPVAIGNIFNAPKINYNCQKRPIEPIIS